MTLADDAVTVTLLASAAFFVALSLGLLVRYRQMSQKISASSDLGHDLWQALEQRMTKQDERILDMMGRLEVIQSRVMAAPPFQTPTQPVSTSSTPALAPQPEKPPGVTESSPVPQHLESQAESQASQGPRKEMLDETQLAAIRLLSEGLKNTRQLTDSLGKSREHTARLMKELFEIGLVKRNDSAKPFVYQLTDEGKHYLS
jgi:predicted transcriptional regulator